MFAAMHKLAALAFLASLTLACDKGDSTGSGDSSSGGTGSATESGASNSNSNDSNATEVSGGTDGATEDLPTTANSVTTPPMTDPTGPTSDPTGDPTSATTETVTSANPTTADPTGDPTGDPDEAATQLCVDTINMYRATLGLPPLARWTDAEVCSDGEAMITGCLEQMWAEGPGEDFNTHGHYINMSSTSYTKVACGFADGMGGVWAVQNFQ
jgi:hypothetical protein